MAERQPQATKPLPRSSADVVFVRKATGLVREVSTLDATIYNLIWSSIPLAAIFLYQLGPGAYPGSSMTWTIILNAVICLPVAFLYAMLSSAMPRSGADYVWVSRSVHPVLGFMSNWNFVIWMLYFIGVYATLIASWGISPLLRVISGYTGNAAFLGAAEVFTKPVGTFAIGLVIVAVSGLVLIFGRGLGTFMRIQKWGVLFYLLGAILLPTLVFAFGGSFPAKFDAYLSNLGGPAAGYKAIMDAANFSPAPFSLLQTVLAMTIPYYVFGNTFQSAYFAGEIKRGKGNHIWSMPGSLFLGATMMLVLTWAIQHGVGIPFLGALSTADPSKVGLDFVPIYTELGAIAAGNVWAGALIPISFTVGMMLWIPQTMVLIGRSLFAWSFDQLMPEKLAAVNEKTHTPVLAMITITVLSLISLAIVTFVPGLTALVGLLGLTITLVSVSLAGILFPYRQRDTWAGSAYNGHMLGMPTVTLTGVLSLAAMVAMALILLVDPNSGTSFAASPGMIKTVAAIYLSGVPIYYLSRWLQRNRGVDIDLAFKEIPPE